MMNRQKFTDFAKKILHPQAGVGRPRASHPEREWLIGLLIAIIIGTGSAAWSAQTYLKYRDISISEPGEDVETVVYRGSLVEAALKEFADRKVNLEILLNDNTINTPDEVSPTEIEEGAMSEEGETPITNEETATSTEEQVVITNEQLNNEDDSIIPDEEISEEVIDDTQPALLN